MFPKQASGVRRVVLILAACAATVAALYAAMGKSFVLHVQGFAQHVYGVSSLKSSSFPLGGVVVLQDGTVISAECRGPQTKLHIFDPYSTFTKSGTDLHKETVSAQLSGACGIAFENVGGQDYIFSNLNDTSSSDGDGTFGVARIAWPSLGVTKMAAGSAGNGLGIAVDPVTGNLVYVGFACRLTNPLPTTCPLYQLNPLSGVVTTFASLPGSQFALIDSLLFDPSGGGELDVLDRAGQVVSRTPIGNDPIGIGFHVSPSFIVTNNTDGTMTEFDFPGGDYTQTASTQVFASNGSRGDMMQAGPDGCLYVTQLQTVYNNGNTDNANSIVQICPGFAPPPGITPNPPPPPSSLCGFVYNDANNNGTKDSGEAAIAGVKINLSGTDYLDLPVTGSTTTSSTGSYCFNNLAAGTYTISEEQPASYKDGITKQGTPGSGSTDYNIFSGIALDAGYNGTNNNFGELLPSSLAGSVFVDTNNDGVRDTAEAGIPNVTIELTGYDDRSEYVGMTGATGSDGAYAFTNLRPGTYTITETQPNGYVDGKDKQGTPGTGTTGNDVFDGITLKQNVTGQNNNFGELSPMPAIALVKKTNGSDNNTAPGIYLRVGSTVTWTYLVTNTGNVPLSAAAVTDDKVGDVACPASYLAVGDTMTCKATGVVIAGQYTNVGTVIANDALGTRVTATDADNYFGSAPRMTLVKTTNDTDNNAAPGLSIPVGSPLTWKYVVTNTGNVALSNLAITDNKIAGTICSAPSLAIGASFTCSKTGTATAGQYTNIGTATAKDPAGATVTASDSDNYFGVNAVVSLVKKTNGTDNNSGPGPVVSTGSTVTWTYAITNGGNVALSKIAVTDDKAGAVTCPAATLAPGASMTCSKTGTATKGQYTNVGTVNATDPGGRIVSAQDVDHYLGVDPPTADLAVTAVAPQTGTAGGTFTYLMKAINNGVTPATNAVLTATLPAGMRVTALGPAPAGWICVVSPTGTTVTCTKPTFAVAETASVTMTVSVACPFPNPAPAAAKIVSTIGSATPDPVAANNMATSALLITNLPPTINDLSVDKAEIWPPNHKMVPVVVAYTVTPACGGTPTVVMDVSSNEGDSSDWKVKDAHHLDVRSERLGTQKEGRVYTITITATDPTGTSSQQQVTVTVPHDQGHGNKK